MRIAMVITSYHPIVGGAERQLQQLVSLMRRAGHDVTIVTRRHEGLSARDEVDGAPVLRVGGVGGGAGFMVAAAITIARLAPDVIHCHSTFSPTLAGLLAAMLRRAPLLAKPMCGGEVASVATKRFGGLRMALMRRRVDRFVAVSAEIARELRDLGVPPERIVRIPNGVDPVRYRPLGDDRRVDEERSLRGLPVGAPLLLFAGRIARQKRLPLLLEAWPQVRAAHPSAVLAIAGANRSTATGRPIRDDKDGDVVPKALLNQPGVIRLGHVPDMEALLPLVDGFILPSAREGLSNALLEACASGAPVVAARIGGTEDVIVNGRNGMLFRPDDRDDLVAAICALLEDETKRRVLGAAARDAVLKAFSITATAERLLAEYEALVDGADDAAASPRRA
jgi:glycosyltransferase involved in cell wall biosynthesis